MQKKQKTKQNKQTNSISRPGPGIYGENVPRRLAAAHLQTNLVIDSLLTSVFCVNTGRSRR